MPSEPDVLPSTGFDPQIFWDLHKGKIVAYGALLIVALVLFAVYQFTTQQRLTAASALLAQAHSAEDYQHLIDQYPHTVAAGNAALLLGQQLRHDKKYDKSAATLQKFTQDAPNHPLISGGWLSLAETQEAQGKMDEAKATYQEVTARFPDSYSAPIAAFELASLLKAQGHAEEARHAYENLVAQYRDSYFAQEAMREMRMLPK